MRCYLLATCAATGVGALVLSQMSVEPVAVERMESGFEGELVKASAPTDPVTDWAADLDRETGPAGSLLDVSCSNIDDLGWWGRVGSFPTGRNSFAMSTTSCNVGTVNVPWESPMDPDHPFIAQNLYRFNEGRLEQIGLSWLKHGFFAADAPGCGNCNDNPFDDRLNVGCQDTYGSGNNADRTWLGPRFEVNPLTGNWDPCGSHFDGMPADCTRDHTGGGHGPLDHRLRVDDADLVDDGDRYFYEAYYIVKGDENPYNNARWREARFSWTGSRWNVNNVGNEQVNTPMIFSWGQMHNIGAPRDAGDAVVAMRTVELGGGVYRYEYAVYNHNLARQVQSFSIEVDDSINVGNFGFHAPLEEEEPYSNDAWTWTHQDGMVTFSTEDYSSNPGANSLRYGTVYTFWFEADAAPAMTTATMNIFEPGTPSQVSVSTKGPGGGTVSGLEMTISELRRGQPATFTVANARPGERVTFLYSQKGPGRTSIGRLNVDIDLARPITILANRTADASGVATLTGTVPANAPLDHITFQAIARRTSEPSFKSNLVYQEILP